MDPHDAPAVQPVPSDTEATTGSTRPGGKRSTYDSLPGRPRVPGMLFVFEGVDGTGKSTRAKHVRDEIIREGGRAELIAFPDRSTPVGQLLDQHLRGNLELEPHAVHLMFSANRWELSQRIQELMDDGVHVILDRYHYSGRVYSTIKGLDPLWCDKADEGLPVPDVVIYMRVAPEEVDRLMQERLSRADERFETRDFVEKAVERFEAMFPPMTGWHRTMIFPFDTFAEPNHQKLLIYELCRRVIHQLWHHVNVPELHFSNPRVRPPPYVPPTDDEFNMNAEMMNST